MVAGTKTAGITPSQRLLLTAVCAVAVSTIYAAQPILESVGADLGLPSGSLGWLVAAGQIGYLAGLILLVPLGDMLNRRRLIVIHLLLTAVGCGITALAPNGGIAVIGLLIAGLFAVVVQVAVAYVAAISPAGDRGRNIGAVTSGVVVGILGVRVLAGAVAGVIGWRVVYLCLALLCALLAVMVHNRLAQDDRASSGRYLQVLSSMGRLVCTDRLLLSRGAITFFLFASFGTLWSGLALPLGAAPWSFDTTTIGLFGLAGLAGAFGATRAGKWADAGYAQRASGMALAMLAASWLLIVQTSVTLSILIAGIVLLDFAVQTVHVSSQQMLAAAHPDRASSVIGLYMAFYSLGSALGAVTTTWAYASSGWWAACLTGALYALAGLTTWAFTGYRVKEPDRRCTGTSHPGRLS